MDVISDVKILPCTESRYIQPVRMHYIQKNERKTWDLITEYDDGLQKTWDAMRVHDSIAILVFNITRKVFIFVKQFRPAVYLNNCVTDKNEEGAETVDTDKYAGELGLTIEFCAGIMDKDHSPEEMAQMELLEECGYKVPLDSMRKITSFRAGVGTTGAKQILFYAEVTDAMRVGQGGGLAEEGELIEVVEMDIEQGKKLIYDETVNRPCGLLFGLQWFFDTIWKQ